MEQDNIENLRKQYFAAILNLQNEQDIIDALPKPEYNSFFPIIYGLMELMEKEILKINKE